MTLAQTGGGYFKLFSDEDIERIHCATLDVLENTGVRFTSEEARRILADAPARVREDGVVYLRSDAVERAIRSTPPQFTRYPLDRVRPPVRTGGDHFHMSPSSLILNVLDLETGRQRPGTLRDMRDYLRLGDALPNFELANPGIWAQDAPPELFHAYYAAGIHMNTGKCTPGGDILSKQIADDVMLLHAITLGSEEEIGRRKTYHFTACPVSALSWGENVVAFIEAAKRGAPVGIMPMPFAGSCHPVTLAGLIVQMNAEILAALVLVQTVNPGNPVLYQVFPGVMDMRAATHSFGCPETALVCAGGAQLARHYRVPVDTITGYIDSKLPDAQAGYEKMMVALLPALAGSNVNSLYGGSLEFGETISFEQLVIDNEIAGNVLRCRAGIRVSEEHLAVDLIAKVGHGGNYLMEEHTLAHFREEIFDARLADRRRRAAWEQDGGLDMRQRAAAEAKRILAEHHPSPIDAHARRELEKAIRSMAKRENCEFVPLE
ncbi:MAG: trimethylamine methyltransferase family protein [Planctomycetota bacterium]